MELTIGTPITKTISAREYWNKTGIFLKAEQEFNFEVSPDDKWVDLIVSCNADGYRGGAYMNKFEKDKRYKGENWFKLIGAINGESPFVIGTCLPTFSPTQDGELFCYANDLISKFWYLNNWGSIDLVITRIR